MAASVKGTKVPVQLAVTRAPGEDPRLITILVNHDDPDDNGAALIRSLRGKVRKERLHSVEIVEPAADAPKPAKRTAKSAEAE